MVRTNSRNNDEAAPVRKGGRVPGAKQYHKPTLYDLVAQYRPISSVMWDLVAAQYRAKTGELKVREGIKRYFVQKCCNNNKKPTGELAPDPFTAKCQTLWRSILANEEASDMEDSDSEMDHEDVHGLVLGQLSNTQMSATQVEDSQDPEYLPTYPEEISETSDSEAEVVNRMESPPSSTMQSVVTKRSVTSDNKSKNIKNSIHQG